MKLLTSTQFAFVAAVMLLIVPHINCDADRKQEIGEKLAEAIKADVHEAFETYIKSLIELSQNLLKEAKPTAEQAETLKSDISDLENFKKDKEHMTPEEIVEKVKKFANEKFVHYMSKGQPVTQHYENTDFAHKEIMDNIQTFTNASRKLGLSIYGDWTELYETLTKEDLAKHAEYEEINELMQGVKSTNGEGAVFLDAVKAAIRFFEYKDWYFFLEFK